MVDFNEIVSILKDINLNLQNITCGEVAEEIISNYCWDKYNLYYGATKLVIYPKKKNYVIKIPFSGALPQEEFLEEDEIEDFHNDPYIFFEDFENAYYPIQNSYGWDYCQSEEEYGKIAKKEHIDKMFALTQYAGTYKQTRIYIQEKGIVQASSNNKITKEEKKNGYDFIFNHFNEGFIASLYNSIIAIMLRYYSTEDCIKLINFLKKWDIRDFNDNNYGYSAIDHRPILIDYSDYNE